MPRKSKPFIDKKTASRFALVHRSQKDAHKDSEKHTDLVLRPILNDGQVRGMCGCGVAGAAGANDNGFRPRQYCLQALPTHLNLDPEYVDFSEAIAPSGLPPGCGWADDDEDDGYGDEEDGEYYDDGEEYDEEEEEEDDTATAAAQDLAPGIWRGGHAPSSAPAAAVKKRTLVFDRWGLSSEEAARMPHDYDYGKHMRPMGQGFFKASSEPIAAHDLYKAAPPAAIDESDLDAKYGGKALPSFDPDQLAKEVRGLGKNFFPMRCLVAFCCRFLPKPTV